MEKSIGSVLLAFVLLTVLLSGCAPASTPVQPATETSSPSPPRCFLVVVGDSIAYNSPIACPDCYGFVTRYAHAIEKATDHPVIIRNLSQLNGLQIDGLLEELKTDAYRRDALANADIIVVNIAHNDTAWLRNDDPCDGPNGENPDWSKYNASCAAVAAEIFRSKFESVFAQIVALRAGKPPIFRRINRYNDWIGWTGDNFTPEGVTATQVVIDAWSAMVCQRAGTKGVP